VAKILYRKIIRFLLFLFKPGKKIWTKISMRFKPSHMNTSLARWILAKPSEYKPSYVTKISAIITSPSKAHEVWPIEPIALPHGTCLLLSKHVQATGCQMSVGILTCKPMGMCGPDQLAGAHQWGYCLSQSKDNYN